MVSPQGLIKYRKTENKPYKYAALLADIKAILAEDEFNITYGKRRMYEKLVLDYDCKHSYNTVAKVLKENGLMQKQNRPNGLTKADKLAQKSENLLKRDFTADKPNEKTVSDIKEWPTSDGKVYSAGIWDCYDNMTLGLGLDVHMRAELVDESVRQAAGSYDLRGAISHSDRGSQYTSELVRATLKEFGITQSMNSAAGRCHDNAKGESMWARGEVEISRLYDTRKMTCEQVKALLFRYYMGYWNNRRICSSIGGIPPALKRAAYYEKQSELMAA
jgi:transposase InsO family protein